MSEPTETVMPDPGTVLKTLSEIPDPGGLPADFEPTPIVVLRSGDTVTAWLNVCPHAGRPFSLPSGKTLVSEGKYLVCPFHGASFDVQSGACVGGPAGNAVLKPVPVKVENGQVVAA